MNDRISQWMNANLGIDMASADPATAALGAAALAGLLALIFFAAWMAARKRAALAEAEIRRVEAVAIKAREILAAAPDGLFLWDHVLGGITVSRRLAVLLNLEAGTHDRYDDIRAKFEGDSLKNLERAITSLRGHGTPFDLMLTSGKRVIQAIGARAETEQAQPIADLIWMRDITESVSGNTTAAGAAGDAINRSGLDDRHLTALLDAMPLPIWLRDSNLGLAFTNRAAAHIAESQPDMAQAARDGGEPVSERRLLDDGGQARLMEVTEVPLGAKGGGTVGFAVDRSDKEQVEGDLQRKSAARDAVLQNLTTPVAIFGEDTRLQMFNSAYAELWELDGGWLATKPDLGEVLERLRQSRKLPEVADFPAFKAAQLAQFTALTAPIEDLLHLPDGRAIRAVNAPGGDGGLVMSFEDVTASLDLERSFNALTAVQRETLNKLHEGIAVFGSDGRLKLSNPVFERLWEIPPDSLGEKTHISDFVERMRPLVDPPEGSEAWDDSKWRLHRDLVVTRLLNRAAGSGRMVLTNGTIVDYANVPLPDGAVLLSYLDVTDSARVETALRQRAEALVEADRLKSAFIANVSYEVRTPLNTIIGFADMLGQDYFGELNKRQREYATGILETSRTLMGVIGDILDLAAIEAGRMDLERDTVDVHGLLVSCLNLINERARLNDLRVTFDCPTDIGWLVADERRLKQILFNLLSNAVSFTPPRGSVRLEARRESGDILLTVSDNGVGIPAAERDRVLRPFERGDAKNGNGDGVGLGLTLVKTLVELHNGSMDIKSSPGRGTTVTCRLPAGGYDAQPVN